MNQLISPKIVALTFGILIISFLAAFYAVAWQEPTQTPPGGNVPTPLNVGPEGQSKAGGLILNTGGSENALIIDRGKICIGSECRDKWPETGVVTTYRLEATAYKVGDKYYSKSVSHSCPDDSTVVNIYLSTRNVTLMSVSGGACIWGCTGPCPSSQANSCSYSVSGSTATLRARVVQRYDIDCGCCPGISLVDYCYPHAVGRYPYNYYSCSLPGGSPQCVMEFQCGKKETITQ